MDVNDPRHGTYAGAQLHRREGEQACELCRRAASDYMRQWRKTAKTNKARNNARYRALWRLAAEHRDEYQRLYAEEVRETLGSPRLDVEVAP